MNRMIRSRPGGGSSLLTEGGPVPLICTGSPVHATFTPAGTGRPAPSSEMESPNALLAAIDAFLIAPYRWPANPYLGWWLGTGLLALWSAVLGEVTGMIAVRANRRTIRNAFSEASDRHDQSLSALQAGDRDLYKDINSLANEAYGKAFFLQITVAAAVLWPVPLAIAWLQLRFAGLRMELPVSIPWLGNQISALFLYMVLYILARILLSRSRSLRQKHFGEKGGGKGRMRKEER